MKAAETDTPSLTTDWASSPRGRLSYLCTSQPWGRSTNLRGNRLASRSPKSSPNTGWKRNNLFLLLETWGERDKTKQNKTPRLDWIYRSNSHCLHRCGGGTAPLCILFWEPARGTNTEDKQDITLKGGRKRLNWSRRGQVPRRISLKK